MDEKVIYLKNRQREQTQKPLTIEEIKQGIESGTLEIYNETWAFEKIQLYNYKVRIYIPAWFTPMPKDMAMLKYPAQNRPKIIYTDEDYAANLTFNHTDSPLQQNEMAEFKDTMKDLLTQMQPSLEWLSEGLTAETGYFDFISPGLGGKIYNQMFFTSLEEKALLCGFNCQEEKMDIWQPVAHGIRQTLQVDQSNVQ